MNLISRLFKTNIKEFSAKRIYLAIIRRIVNIPHLIMWYFPTTKNKINKINILKLKDIHKGKRCFIVANGPSLKNTDLSLLKDEITIGMNRIYLLDDFKPTYLAVADIEIQLKQFFQEYNDLQIIKFFPWEVRNSFDKKDNLILYKTKFSARFNKKFNKLIGPGKSVTYICFQLAYYMGFSEVILIGKDHSYSHDQKGVPGTRIKSTGNESNHFISGYYKEGMKWTIPNYKDEEYSYQLAKEAFESDNRIILDATIDGKLNVFRKVDYYSLFNKK